MNSKFAAGALTALIYFQGLLGFAGVATVLLKERADAPQPAHHASLPASAPSAL